jgi:hypothetical protein
VDALEVEDVGATGAAGVVLSALRDDALCELVPGVDR